MIIHPPIRSVDAHGMGHYKAPRTHGMHNGIDVACYDGSQICAIESGTVTNIGRPYFYENPENNKEILKNALRYVQVTGFSGLVFRYFYVQPQVKLNNTVFEGQVIGESQDIQAIYGMDMTAHIHVEIKKNGVFIDPTNFVFGD